MTIAWYPVVPGSWLIVPQMLEVSGVGMREIEWHVSVSIINGIALLSFQELFHVMFHDWALSMGGILGSSRFSLDAISESEDVFESGVLKSVWVNID